MNNLFPPELRTAALVDRWSIVRTIGRDSVAHHSYFVSIYAVQIARLINWSGPLGDLTYYALMHDIEEVITGDLLGPVKRAIVDDIKFGQFIHDKMREHVPLVDIQMDAIVESARGHEIQAIVKVADKVDAVLFLLIETAMGNMRLLPLYRDALLNLETAWYALSEIMDEDPERYRDTWDNELYPALQAHHKFGGIGLV